MATHSSILAWEILCYSPWGHIRVRHNLLTKQQPSKLPLLLKDKSCPTVMSRHYCQKNY